MSFRSSLEALILGALDGCPSHGYAIAQSIETQGAGVLKLGENQLYPLLHRLERNGHIKSEWQIQEGKPSRKVYALTESGASELGKYRQQWDAFAEGVNSVLHGRKEVKNA